MFLPSHPPLSSWFPGFLRGIPGRSRRPSAALILAGVLFTLPLAYAEDCNLNGVEDVEDVAALVSADCDGNQVPDECELLLVGFGIGDDAVDLAADPRGLVVADLNGDGFDDLAAIYRDVGRESKLTVALSRGDRTFEPQTVYDARSNISFVTHDDLDGDGDVDIVTANSTELLVFRNRGDGTLEVPDSIPVENLTRFVAAADISGDGLPELLTVNNRSDTLSVFTNNDGTFTAGQELFVGDLPVFVAGADFDDDGDVDLVLLESDTGEVVIYDNPGPGEPDPGTMGTPRFGSGVGYPTGTRPSTLRIGDFDTDGALDILTINSSDTSILFNRGDGTFEVPEPYAILSRAVQSGDFDRDGKQDPVLFDAQQLNLRLLPGNGSRRLGTAGVLVNLPRSVVDLGVGDLDGDGDAEIVFSSSTPTQLDVFWNSSGIPLAFEKVVAPNSTRPHSGTVRDFNGDGFLDVITANGNNNMNYSILLGRGDVILSPPVDVPIPVSPASLAAGGRSDLNFLTSADVEGDGDFDLAIVDRSYDEVILLYNRGDGNFDEWAFLPTGVSPFSVIEADFDADGTPDFATANQLGDVSVLLNRGDGTYAAGRQFAVGRDPLAVKAADLDGDGDQDIVTANRASSDLSVLIGDGAGSFATSATIPIVGGCRFVIPGDFDRDGFPDLATANATGSVSVLRNVGDGTFSAPVEYPLDEAPYSVDTADLNGDGLLDVFTANEASGTLSILAGNGDGSFLRRVNLATSPERGAGPRYAMTGDFDGDGDTDLISLNRNSAELTYYRNSLGGPMAEEDFLDTICTVRGFQSVAVPTRAGGSERATKYLVPAAGDAEAVPTLFQNVQRFPLQPEFLTTVFPERFEQLGPAAYNRLVGLRETRQYFAGSIRELREGEGLRYAFTVAADTSDPVELLTEGEVRSVYDALRGSFLLEPLCYLPEGAASAEQARAWGDPGFGICFPEEVVYEAFTRAVGYGRVRILTAAELAEATVRGEVTFQDILVLREAASDLDIPVGGLVTEESPTPLAPVVVRAAREGIPHARVANATGALAPFAGKLVRLEVGDTDYEVREASPQDALEFWAKRPRLDLTPQVDPEFGELPTLLEIAQLETAGSNAGGARFGAQTLALARLAGVLEGTAWSTYVPEGFGLPTRYGLDFALSNGLPSALDLTREVSYADYVGELLADDQFRTDSRFRRQTLSVLTDHMRSVGDVDPELVGRIAERVAAVFGEPSTVPSLFGSSPNVDDTVSFRTALRSQVSAGCPEDDLDDNDAGPSHCDATSPQEQTIARSLRAAWAAPWHPSAYEEREYFGVPHAQVTAGVLVTPSTQEPVAYGTAFTGNPADARDPRFVVSAQIGIREALPGGSDVAERNLLEVVDSVTQSIARAESSSLVAVGDVVLSDGQLTELGGLLAFLDGAYPVDLGGYPREQILLEVEFEVFANGELAIERVRPFLLENFTPVVEFALQIPADLEVCGVFGVAGANRGPRDEYALKSRVRFRGGTVTLSTARESFAGELFAEVLFGPEREPAVARADGSFRVQSVAAPDGLTVYRFNYEQEYTLADGRSLLLEIVRPLSFGARDGEPVDATLVLDEAYFTAEPGSEALQAALDGQPLIRYGSCEYSELPRFEVVAEFADGATLRLEEKFAEATSAFATGPASLLRAEFSTGATPHVVTDYFQLVYSAFRHNTAVSYWMVFDTPLDVPNVEGPVGAIELFDERENLVAPENPLERRAAYLGEDFEVLREVEVVSFRKGAPLEPPRFQRGDINADGGVAIDDAIDLLEYLFRRGVVPECRKTADSNDDGRTNLVDAIDLLRFLFQPEAPPLSPPSSSCGLDPTPDPLGCTAFAPCGEDL